MILKAHFFLLNDDFSPEYAEANHGGKESDNNPLYEWEDELEVADVVEVNVERKAIYTLAGEFSDGKGFSYDLPDMFMVSFKNQDDVMGFFAISESILDTFEYNEEEGVLKAFIKDYEPFGNPIPGVYIASKEFPVELAD